MVFVTFLIVFIAGVAGTMFPFPLSILGNMLILLAILGAAAYGVSKEDK